jgi:hypothetical protein
VLLDYINYIKYQFLMAMIFQNSRAPSLKMGQSENGMEMKIEIHFASGNISGGSAASYVQPSFSRIGEDIIFSFCSSSRLLLIQLSSFYI